jgi:hypothetical protein
MGAAARIAVLAEARRKNSRRLRDSGDIAFGIFINIYSTNGDLRFEHSKAMLILMHE